MLKNRQMQIFDNHGYKNIVTYPTGVTKGSINPQKSSENHWFSELFLFTPLPNRRKILKLRVCKKGAVKLMLQTAPSIECISLFFNILQRYTFAIAAPS